MSSISRIGPATPPPPEPNKIQSLGQAIDAYATILSPSNSTHNLEQIAKQTVELVHIAHAVMHATSPVIRGAAGDLEKLLQCPLSIPGMSQDVSILTASEHYLANPATAELKPLVDELFKNNFALERMCNELSLLSSSIKNPNAPVA